MTEQDNELPKGSPQQADPPGRGDMLRAVLDTVDAYAAVLDEAGLVLEVGGARVDAARGRHWVGKGFDSIAGEAGFAPVKEAMDLAVRTRAPVTYRADPVEPNGAQRHLSCRLQQHATSGGQGYWVNLATDAQGTVDTEDTLAQVRERLALCAALNDVGFWSCDTRGERIDWDATASRIHGLAAEQSTSSLDQYLKDLRPTEADRFRKWFASLEHSDLWRELLLRYPTAAGERILLCRGRCHRTAVSGEEAVILGATMDVTKRRLQEDQATRASHLASLIDSTQKIAHDFRNALQIVTLELEELDSSFANHSGISKSVEVALQAAQGGTKLATELMNLDVPQQPKHHAIALDIRLKALGERLQRSMPEGAVVALELEPLQIWGDWHQLERALWNLCLNARQALPAGAAGTIAINAHEVVELGETDRLRLGLAEGAYVRIDVADNGVGIAAADLSRIFEPTYTARQGGGGTGLGLPSALTIVQKHQGAIDVESTPQRGTTVSVYLPLTSH